MKHEIAVRHLESQVRKFKMFILECQGSLITIEESDHETRSTFEGYVNVYSKMVEQFENAIEILKADS